MSDTSRNDTSHHLLGRVIDGRYQVIEAIGEGQMAAVYLAQQINMERNVAIKVLRKDLCEDKNAMVRFHREVEAVARLRSPHTIEFYDYGETENGALYIAMELLTGETLRHALEHRGPLAVQETHTIVSQVAMALGEAHAEGVIHRDLKPENVHLGTRNTPLQPFVKVLDFGLAKIQEPVDGIGTITGKAVTVGTPAYLAPEAAVSGRVEDWRCDIYALGVMVFEMLTGQLPFQAKNPLKMLYQHAQAPIPSARQLRADLSEDVDVFFRRALAKDAKDRFPSAPALANAFGVVALGFGGDA